MIHTKWFKIHIKVELEEALSDKPDISVIIPTLNEEKWLERCLLSLRSQDIEDDYETIVVDGYSSDRTIEIACKYVDKIVFEKRRTVAAARQTASYYAEGKVIAFGCADTFYPPNWLREITRPIVEDGCGASIGVVMPFDGNWIEVAFAKCLLEPTAHVLSKSRMYYSPGETIAFDRRIFRLVGGFNTHMITNEDHDLLKRISGIARVAFNPMARAYVSMRRVRKWGRIRYLTYHFTNFVAFQLFRSAYTLYEPIR